MCSQKTNKSYKKRLRITKKGKVLKRKPGHNHFNAKESRSKQLKRKGLENFKIKNKDLSRYLPHN